MVGSTMIATGLPASRVLSDVDRGFAVDAQPFGVSTFRGLAILFLEIGEDGVGFWNFF